MPKLKAPTSKRNKAKKPSKAVKRGKRRLPGKGSKRPRTY